MKRFWVSLLALLIVGALFATGMAEGLEAVGDDYEQETDDSYDSSDDAYYDEEVEEQDEFLIGGDETESEMAAGYADFVWDGDEPDGEYAVSAPEAEPESGASDFWIVNGVLVKYEGTGGDVVIPNGVTSIGYGAFEFEDGCNFVTSVVIPDGVTSIGDWAFYNCTSLTNVMIPNSVTSIGMCAFAGCSSLPNITIPNSITSIGECVFSECDSLTSVTIPDSVTSIELAAFEACASLKSVTIPNSVTSIDGDAFKSCSSLTSITIPASVEGIGPEAFSQCGSLTEVYFESASVVISDKVYLDGDGDEYEVDVFKGRNSNLTFYCKSGSTAEAYAKKWGIKYKLTDVRAYALEKKGKNGTITATIGTPFYLTPIFATNAKTTVKKYRSSKPKVATVTSAGLVTPKKAGTTTITVTTGKKKVKATIKIKVIDPTKPTGVKLKEGKTITLKVGEKLTLTPVLTPTGAQSNLKWKSNRKKIASVDKNGVITAKKKGKAKITVTTTKNKKAKATIIIKVVK